jgi:hypothetical protein
MDGKQVLTIRYGLAMGFFEERKAEPKPRRHRRLRRDEFGRPTLIVPAYLVADVVLAVSDEMAVLMHGIACYPRGFGFSLEATSRYELSYEEEEAENLRGAFQLWGGANENAGRFGIAYSDGRRATIDGRWWPRKGAKEDLTISPGGGGSGGGHWTTELWVQPLPPRGPVTFAVEWQGKGIKETLHVLEGDDFSEAAKRAKRVFPSRRA